MRHVLLFPILFLFTAIAVDLQVEYEWKYVDFVWNSSQDRQEAIKKGDYDVHQCVLFDVDKAEDGRVFVTSVRDKGVPASVMTITDKIGDGGPLLRPYPDWSWYRNGKCEGITGVYRVFIKCNHLFVLDSGKIGENKICSPEVLIFDLSNDKLVQRIKIPNNVATNSTGYGLLTTLIVSISDCSNFLKDMTIFISDTEGYGLIVYNADSSKFNRIESDSMKPTNGKFTINKQSFFFDDGILGLTLVRKDLYYAALAGIKIYKMDIEKLQKHLSHNHTNIDQIIQLRAMLSGQTGPMTSQDCAIFFSNIPGTSILCADAYKNIGCKRQDVVMQDSVKLQFPSGMKIIKKRGHGDHASSDNFLTILTNRLQRALTNTLDLNETNFRILSINTLEIRNTTKCFDSCK